MPPAGTPAQGCGRKRYGRMKTREDLKALYDTVLRPELEQFESQRRKIVKKLILAGFGLLAVLAAVAAVLFGVVQDKRPLFAFSGSTETNACK